MPGNERYARQMRFAPIGASGQDRLARASVVIVGCGATGGAIADHLARAGVGRLLVIDRDVVEESNLHRQTLFTQEDAARAMPKALAARDRLRAANPEVTIEGIVADVEGVNAERLITGAEPRVIVDGTDTFQTRLVLCETAVKLGVAMAYTGAVGSVAMHALLAPGGPCFRCLVGASPLPGTTATCETHGVIGPAAGVAGGLAAAGVLRYLCGPGELAGPQSSLMQVDAWTGEHRSVSLGAARDPACPVCVKREFPLLSQRMCGESETCGDEAVRLPGLGQDVDLSALAGSLRLTGATVNANDFLVRATLPEGGLELTIFRDGRCIVRGTRRAEVARATAARYLGG